MVWFTSVIKQGKEEPPNNAWCDPFARNCMRVQGMSGKEQAKSRA